ncbi:hypothetical protein P171DRAFT_486385 [Karstenula rhodostoma CBS 690.94]|uniref:Uncharacterized protein n=1 Tax=Karstenula rhodostoma CBS 690.94 TaxID=1392251 RepID=A0A9P4UC08_9PLEO|nr:hypothetical protein P171DRAFT_486385 [Karstenula rhodostoma CBS 690.94]
MPVVPEQVESSPHITSAHENANNGGGKIWTGAMLIPFLMVFLLFASIMIWAWNHRHDPPVKQNTPCGSTAREKPELDGRDARIEAGYHVHGAELDAGLRAELLGCVVGPQPLENSTVAVEMGGDCAYKVLGVNQRACTSNDRYVRLMLVIHLLHSPPPNGLTINRPPVNRPVANRSLANLTSAHDFLQPVSNMLDRFSVLPVAVVPVVLVAALVPVPFPVIVVVVAPPVIVVIAPAVFVFVWGVVMKVLGVARDEDGGGGGVGLEVGGGVGLDVGGRGGEGLVVGREEGLDVGVGGAEGLVVGGNGGEGFEVGGAEGVGLDVGDIGDEGTGNEIGGTDFEDEGTGGTGFEEEIGGMGLVVGNGGTMVGIVVLKTGGEGLTVVRLRVGKLNVGSGIDSVVTGVEDAEGTGMDEDVGVSGLDVGNGGKAVELRMGDEMGGRGLVVGKGGTAVELRTGGEGLTGGMLKDGKLSDGRLSDGKLNDGKLRVGRLIVGSGLDVKNGGARVELRIGDEGLAVGRVSVGKPVELKTGGGGGGRNVNVGIGGRGVIGRVELEIGTVGIPIRVVGNGRDKLGGDIEGSDGRVTFELGSGSVSEGRAVGRGSDGSDNEGSDKDGSGSVGRTVGRVIFGGEGSESRQKWVATTPKLKDEEFRRASSM